MTFTIKQVPLYFIIIFTFCLIFSFSHGIQDYQVVFVELGKYFIPFLKQIRTVSLYINMSNRRVQQTKVVFPNLGIHSRRE